ncbi:hypothetical protein EV361DRAFT_871614 [Lentinula raphanica]|nr:hypothetical protein EV361DRAFT_871614 [Lentinula raphanica]
MSYHIENSSYIHQQVRSDGIFNYAHDMVINGGSFNIVHGNSMVYYYLINGDEEKIPEWLVAPNCSANYFSAAKRHVTGTGQWILQHPAYLRWKENKDILWIEGKAGSGKTFLMQVFYFSGFI